MKNKLVLLIQQLSPTFRKVVANMAWLFADRFMQMGLGLLIGIWVARYLGPEQLGVFNYAIAFVSLFNPLTTLGLDSIVVRDLAQDSSRKHEILGTAWLLKLLSGLLTLLLTTAIISLLRPDDRLTHWLVGIIAAGTIFQSFETIDFWFRSQIESKYTVFAKNIAYIIAAIIKIALIQMQSPLVGFACIKAGDIALSALALLFVYHRQGQLITLWRVNLPIAQKLLKDSWPVIFSGISIYIYAQIDQVMLGQMAAPSSLGIYSVSVKLSEVFNIIPTVIYSSLLPALVKKYQEGENVFLETMQGVYDLMAVLWFLIAIAISPLSDWIVDILYGEAYADAGNVLAVYIWSQFGSNFGTARALYINVKNLFRISLIISIVGAVINIILNSWLIPQYQAMGATVATLITYFIATIFMNLFFADLRKLVPLILKSLVIPQSLFRLKKMFMARKLS